MAINVGKKPSPHGEAAQDLTEVQTKKIKNGEEELTAHEAKSVPVALPPLYETLEVGVSFRMPVAQYTMLEFTVRRNRPFDPEKTDADKFFDETKEWVEKKLNSIIAEQQSPEE